MEEVTTKTNARRVREGFRVAEYMIADQVEISVNLVNQVRRGYRTDHYHIREAWKLIAKHRENSNKKLKERIQKFYKNKKI